MEPFLMIVEEDQTDKFELDLKAHPDKYENKVIFVKKTKLIIAKGTTWQCQ